jgi:hypothetical protein
VSSKIVAEGDEKAARWGGAKHGILTAKKKSSSLDRGFAPTHIRIEFNIAKGGDPMSHGSAERSVKSVREMKA